MSGLHFLKDESGNGTVTVTALVAVAIILTCAVLFWTAATHASMRAASAADLAALAAADTARGLRAGDPCGIAGSVSAENDALLQSCAVEADGTSVRVTVSVPVNFTALDVQLFDATARARAGAPPLDQR